MRFFCHEFCHGIADTQINTVVIADGFMSSSLSLAIPQNPRKHGVFGGFLMLMTNPMTNGICRLKTDYVTSFVMNFVMTMYHSLYISNLYMYQSRYYYMYKNSQPID